MGKKWPTARTVHRNNRNCGGGIKIQANDTVGCLRSRLIAGSVGRKQPGSRVYIHSQAITRPEFVFLCAGQSE